MNTFTCSVCGEIKPVHSSGGTGYGKNTETGEKVCYSCCGKQDLKFMKNAKPGEKIFLYLNKEFLSEDKKSYRYIVSNWPGSLKFNCYYSSNGRHNFTGTRTDIWFGNNEIGHWWGVLYGNNTQICHCTKLKSKRS